MRGVLPSAAIAIVMVVAVGCRDGEVADFGERDFGITRYGEKTRAWTLQGAGGLRMSVSDYGCGVCSLELPDGQGGYTGIAPAFDSAERWDAAPGYFNLIIGRYANRIAGGRFTLDGTEYALERNEPTRNAFVHGGSRGWHTYVWEAHPFRNGDDIGIEFTRTFPDGDGGFPGTVEAKVTYTITRDNVWRIEYDAVTDRPTPISPTQHLYLNLDGEGTILDHELQISAGGYLEVDDDLSPIGGPAKVDGTPFDFREYRRVGEFRDDYDHNWCLDGEGFRRVARLRNARYAVEVWTDQPGLQFFAGKFSGVNWSMAGGKKLVPCGYLALEPQHWPDSPNHPDYPSTILRPGERYRSITEYHFLHLR